MHYAAIDRTMKHTAYGAWRQYEADELVMEGCRDMLATGPAFPSCDRVSRALFDQPQFTKLERVPHWYATMARTYKTRLTAAAKALELKEKAGHPEMITVQEEDVPTAEISVVIPLRPKRRPKIPKSRLGEVAASKPRALSSSLPPSSPPPLGRVLTPPRLSPGPQLQDIVEEDSHVGNGDDFEFGHDSEDDEDQFKAANTSDPFGFLAVERKIKRQRMLAPEPRHEDFELPTTPHKQKLGKRPAPTSPSICLSNMTLPSTPSPEKLPLKRRKASNTVRVAEKENEQRDGSPRKRNPKKKRDVVIDPEALDLSLRALLPKSTVPTRMPSRKPRSKAHADVKTKKPTRTGTRSQKADLDCEEIEYNIDEVGFLLPVYLHSD